MIDISKKEKSRGISLLGVLFLGLMLIFVLSYLGVDIKAVVQNPTTQNNINYVKGSGETVWDSFLKRPVSYLWNDVFIQIFWQSFINNMQRIRDGKPTDFENAAPQVPLTSGNTP